ncbi:MAG: hypothetical protein AAGD96_04375 [Chloroflexota bacterium]
MNFENLQIISRVDASLNFEDGKLTIKTDTGSMWGMDNRCHNLCVAPKAFQACTAEINLEILPQRNGEQAGLVLLIDADNYIKFVREMVDDKQVVVLAKELDGLANVELLSEFEPAALTLKLQHDGSQLIASWKAIDESDFHTQSFPNWFAEGSIYRPGLLVHGNNSDNQVMFKSFLVED